MTTPKLKPCPFCGVTPHIYWEAWKDISPDAGVWKLEANHKDSCYITHINGTNISGRSSAKGLSQLVEWWNHREELFGNSEQLESGHEKDHVADPGKMVGDLISRQAAIDALKNRWKKTRNYEGNGDDIAEECELYLKQVSSAQPEQRWIPFKTRPLTKEEKEEHPEWDGILDCKLPDDGQRILVSVSVRGHESIRYDEFYTDDGSYLDSGYEIGTEATAWMPLPEPYREDEE